VSIFAAGVVNKSRVLQNIFLTITVLNTCSWLAVIYPVVSGKLSPAFSVAFNYPLLLLLLLLHNVP
jgi:hypothetical protein